ncbi:hypothetical protein E4U13_005041 [Claviceps humidiphila]|uniref:Uncharacterized protein n=1 Tax=Claviceps humidiphila TaxID=1294629 RepID=A0A9P7TW65_9HYPO|nr:hypothetical protein E4U13_005041 [Claviceps humidiphila]
MDYSIVPYAKISADVKTIKERDEGDLLTLVTDDWTNTPLKYAHPKPNWSTHGYKYIHNKSRNRLKNERVEKLVYIYTNARLLWETTKEQQWSNEWFFGDDSEDGTEEGLRGLGLSLDSIYVQIVL